MSKLCMRNREIKRIALVRKFAQKRADLKAILSNQNKTVEEHEQARIALQCIPRNANPTRLRNRCAITGRSRGTFRQFGLARHKVREISFRGEAPGMMKSSW